MGQSKNIGTATYAPSEQDAPPGVDVVPVDWRLVVVEGEDPDDEDEDRGHEHPADAEDDARLPARHVLDVSGQSPHAVQPHDGDGLEESDVHEGDGRRVVVDNLEEVDAALEEVGEAGEEGDEAHEEDHELVANALGAEDVLEAVLDGGDDDLDHGELAVDAEDDEHEEEDDCPELRTNQR